jgi:3-oxoacyl-[acyl-carrier protein] reductase
METAAQNRDKIIWLTGASGGLGTGIARDLATAGYSLALHSFSNPERLKKQDDELRANGHNTILLNGDLSIEGVANEHFAEIKEKLGIPSSIVHLAGPLVSGLTADQSRKDFDLMINGNLTSFFEVIRAAIPDMRINGGSIVAVGMVGAQHTTPFPKLGAHLAAKSGLVALAKTIAIEEAPNKIRVNVISPGNIVKKDRARDDARKVIETSPSHPMGVRGSYEDVADAILYLISSGASYVTGTVLDVNGGWMGHDWRHLSKR